MEFEAGDWPAPLGPASERKICCRCRRPGCNKAIQRWIVKIQQASEFRELIASMRSSVGGCWQLGDCLLTMKSQYHCSVKLHEVIEAVQEREGRLSV